MPQTKKTAQPSVYDAIVADAVKSVVAAPANPNGGERLPLRQRNQPRNKDRDGENYMAIFDREAQESDDQLDDWMRYTQAVTDSPEDFVNDDDDIPADPDEADEDSRGNPEYDPYSDDDQDDAVIDLTDGEYTHVRAHKRRLKKSRGDHDAEFDALSDDDEDEDDPEDDLEEDSAADRKAKKVAKAAKESTTKSLKKSRPDDDDDLDEDDNDPEHNTEDEDEDDTHAAANAAERKQLEKARRRSMKKALGRDALDIVDGNAFAKALAEAVWDLRDDVVAEVRTTNLTLRKQNRALAQRVAQLEGKLHKALQGELQQVTKSLASVLVAPAADPGVDLQQAVRKGYGAPVQTRPKYDAGFNWERALEVLEKSWRDDPESPVKETDLTLLEGNKVPNGLSAGAIAVLRTARLV